MLLFLSLYRWLRCFLSSSGQACQHSCYIDRVCIYFVCQCRKLFFSPVIYSVYNQWNVSIIFSYRRAPEYPFPVPLDDCVTAVKYFISNAQKFNVDRNRIGLTGKNYTLQVLVISVTFTTELSMIVKEYIYYYI